MSTVLVAGARTPMGRLLGGLSGVASTELGATAIRGALERAGVAPDRVDHVILGQVLTAGTGQHPARQAAAAGGVPMSVPALSINKVCLSGVQAVILADQYIRSGLATTVVAGGQESMSRAPHLLLGSRTGTKYGAITMADHMELDGLFDAFTQQAMGLLTEDDNDRHPIERARMDEFAARSQQRAARAQDDGTFAEEIVPVEVPQRRGAAVVVDRDEGVRGDTTVEILAGLPGAFRKDGAVTAGNSSPINDGACALVLMDRDAAEREGIAWIAEIGAPGMVAGPDSTLQTQPANAIRDACRREGIEPADLDLIEINEAFAAVVLASADDLGVDIEKVNVNGGAIALGHPIGMSGARLVLHLALELRRRGGGIGAVALCGGGGQGDALIIRVPKDGAAKEDAR
jgi:acetyl-CoA C-acetyltransferase